MGDAPSHQPVQVPPRPLSWPQENVQGSEEWAPGCDPDRSQERPDTATGAHCPPGQAVPASAGASYRSERNDMAFPGQSAGFRHPFSFWGSPLHSSSEAGETPSNVSRWMQGPQLGCRPCRLPNAEGRRVASRWPSWFGLEVPRARETPWWSPSFSDMGWAPPPHRC